MNENNLKKAGVVLAPNLIKKRSFITSTGQVIKEEENPGAIGRYLRTRR